MNYKCPLCTGELRLDNHTRDYFTNCEWPKVCDTGPSLSETGGDYPAPVRDGLEGLTF